MGGVFLDAWTLYFLAWSSTLMHNVHAVKQVRRYWTVYSVIDPYNAFSYVPLAHELKRCFGCEVLWQKLNLASMLNLEPC